MDNINSTNNFDISDTRSKKTKESDWIRVHPLKYYL
jgi:hypothetical protein